MGNKKKTADELADISSKLLLQLSNEKPSNNCVHDSEPLIRLCIRRKCPDCGRIRDIKALTEREFLHLEETIAKSYKRRSG